ncbi:MAG: S41 family peptidase [candidate division KSB1 bacterium]|nr:S41 family peptidase [candidate division KSB1 bacterium]
MKKPSKIRLLFLSLAVVILVTAPAVVWPRVQQAVSKWMILTIILDRIQRFYVEDRNPEELLDYAIDGVMAHLDQYSQYLSPEEAKEYAKRYQGYYGVGLSFRLTTRGYIVSSIQPKSPAAAADVRIGDAVLKIDGRTIANHSLQQLEQFISSRRGEEVEIELIRPPENITVTVRPAKRQVDLPCIPSACLLSDSIGYIPVYHFGITVAEEFDRVFDQLMQIGMKRLLLDLRNNPGGDLSAGIRLAERLIPPGRLIAYTKGRTPESEEQYVSSPPRRLPTLPLIVLVNEKSASDAEIVAGAVQDWDRGLIVGRRTYGKAMVQTEYPFQDGSLLLLTTARFYTPLGRLIQKEGSNVSDQVFRTPKGRTLTAGGGIAPDHEITKTGVVSPLMKRLKSSAVDPFYDFADFWVLQNGSMSYTDIQTFLNQFVVTEQLLRKFFEYSVSRRLSIGTVEFEQNKKEAADELFIAVAHRLFGEEGRIAASARRDEEVTNSLNFFDEAARLLAK